RTVGWFTAIAPVRIDLSGCAVPAAAVSRVRRELDGLRGRDQDWGLLRYAGARPAGHPLLSVPERQVSYNYLGFFDGAGPEPDARSEGGRQYVHAVAAVAGDDELELAGKCSAEVHPAEEVRALLDRCAEVLEELLADGGAASGAAHVDHAELLRALEEVSLGDDSARPMGGRGVRFPRPPSRHSDAHRFSASTERRNSAIGGTVPQLRPAIESLAVRECGTDSAVARSGAEQWKSPNWRIWREVRWRRSPY